MIQIGATEDADKAHDLLARAKAKAGLASAKPFTEKVQKGGGTLWRARFAGPRGKQRGSRLPHAETVRLQLLRHA